MTPNNLSDKVIERLILYRQVLYKYKYASNPHIHSSDLARILNIGEENVRRDFMLIGCKSTTNRKGFNVNTVIERITQILEPTTATEPVPVAIIGNDDILRESLTSDNTHHKMKLSAVFDFGYTEPVIKNEIPYYPISYISEVIEQKGIRLVVINTSEEQAELISQVLAHTGIKGVVNFSQTRIQLPENIYVEEINPLSKLEKALYYTSKEQP